MAVLNLILRFVVLKILFSLLLISPTANGNKETTCTARDWKTLQCNFPQNINTTRKDYGVYFMPDAGGEEKVVDCVWINDQLHCIRQEGFECNEQVSDKATIEVPERFVKKEGSFRCNMNGYRTDNFSPCRFLETTVKEHYAACEANTPKEESKVVLNCKFSVDVDSFIVKRNTTVVASFTKSQCQSSSPVCLHQPGDHHDIFSVTLDVESFPHGTYECHPEYPSPHLHVEGCSLNRDKQTETSYIPVVAVVVPLICGMALVSAAVSFLVIRKLIMIKKDMNKKKEFADDMHVKIPLSCDEQ